MSMRIVLATLILLAVAEIGRVPAADPAKPGEEGMVYELRIYTCNPGKLDDLHKRFRDHTMQLFEKHGMKNVGYWVPMDKPDTLVYLLAHKSRKAADQSWKDFLNDPEWKAVYKESHKNGVLVKKVDRQYLTATDYSAMK